MKHPLLDPQWDLTETGDRILIHHDEFLVYSWEKSPGQTLDEAVRKGIEALAPLPFARLREQKLCQGIVELARKHGTEIAHPLAIDGNGEISVIGAKEIPGNPNSQLRPYGEAFAAILCKYPVRCGIVPSTGYVLPSNTWCRMNHFDVERMLRADYPEFPFIGHDR